MRTRIDNRCIRHDHVSGAAGADMAACNGYGFGYGDSGDALPCRVLAMLPQATVIDKARPERSAALVTSLLALAIGDTSERVTTCVATQVSTRYWRARAGTAGRAKRQM